MKVILLVTLVVCSVKGATYNEELPVHGEKLPIVGVAEPGNEDIQPLPLPSHNETLHQGLVHAGNPHLRAATGSLATTDAAVQKQITDEHNRLRRLSGSTNSFKMSWDADAQKIAQQWADKCEFRHPTTEAERGSFLKTPKYKCGQNLAMGTGAMTWNQSIGMWYNEIKDFKFGAAPAAGKVVGHYTAIVWAQSYAVGCGYKLCKAGTPQQFHYFVCDYCPAGNVAPNQYKPFEKGTACAKCPKNCENGLCTNPCPHTNELSNCEAATGGYPPLFPSVPCPANSFVDKCKATCQCKGKLLY